MGVSHVLPKSDTDVSTLLTSTSRRGRIAKCSNPSRFARMVPPSSPPFDIHAQCHAGSFALAAASKSNTLSASATLAITSDDAAAPPCASSEATSICASNGLDARSRRKLRRELEVMCGAFYQEGDDTHRQRGRWE